jgi:L-tartrate/succinate antiporter
VVVPLAVGAAIALLPAPPGLGPRAWHYFALFAAVMVALVLEPLPAAAVGLAGVATAAVLRLPFSAAELTAPGFDAPSESVKWALAGFSNPTVWLIFAAFMFALGYERTGLGQRIALALVKRLGRRTLGLGFLPVGLPLVAVLPLLVFVLRPPEVQSSPEVPRWAAGQLAALGRLKRREIVMAALAVTALASWIFGRDLVDPAAVAVAVVAAMVVCRIVTWDEVLAHKPARNILAWFATLVTLAEGLNRVGFIAWLTRSASTLLSGLPPDGVMIALVAFFFFVHYLFASLSAHATAVLPVVLAAGAGVPGIPIARFALLLCYSLGIMGVITPFATGPAPVYFGSGYLSRRDFWTLGFVFGLIFFAALVAGEILLR